MLGVILRIDKWNLYMYLHICICIYYLIHVIINELKLANMHMYNLHVRRYLEDVWHVQIASNCTSLIYAHGCLRMQQGNMPLFEPQIFGSWRPVALWVPQCLARPRSIGLRRCVGRCPMRSIAPHVRCKVWEVHFVVSYWVIVSGDNRQERDIFLKHNMWTVMWRK